MKCVTQRHNVHMKCITQMYSYLLESQYQAVSTEQNHDHLQITDISSMLETEIINHDGVMATQLSPLGTHSHVNKRPQTKHA